MYSDSTEAALSIQIGATIKDSLLARKKKHSLLTLHTELLAKTEKLIFY